MKFELKTLSPDAVPAALEKTRLYRLLNEPGEAEQRPQRASGRLDWVIGGRAPRDGSI